MPETIPSEAKKSIGLKYLFPIGLFLLWLFHFVDTEWRFLPEPVIHENRQLAEKPAFDINHLDPFPAAYEEYYNDHFAWRKYLIKWNAKLGLIYHKPSAFPDKVITGKNKWLFKAGEQLQLYQGTRKLSQEELKILANDLQSRSDSVKQRGGEYFLSFAPLKHHIYSELLPENVLKSREGAAVEQLVQYLKEHTDIAYIDLYTPFRAWKNSNPDNDTLLYFRTDHHWTNKAGLIATKVLLKRFREDFPRIPLFDERKYTLRLMEVNGLSLAQLLGIEESFKDQWSKIEPSPPYLAERVERPDIIPPPSFGYPKEYAMDFRQGDSTQALPSIFINRESFANNIKYVLPDYFSKTFLLFDAWQHNFNGPVYYKEGGDIYLQLIWEGFLLNLLPDHNQENI